MERSRLSHVLTRARAPVVESLEPRRLFAGGLIASARAQLTRDDASGAVLAAVSAVAPAAAGPMVTGARLSSGTGTAYLDAFVAADIHLPNIGHGVDASTLSRASVRLFKSSSGPG